MSSPILLLLALVLVIEDYISIVNSVHPWRVSETPLGCMNTYIWRCSRSVCVSSLVNSREDLGILLFRILQ